MQLSCKTAPATASLPTYRYPHTSHIVAAATTHHPPAIERKGTALCVGREEIDGCLISTKTTQQNFPCPSLSLPPSLFSSPTLDRHQQLQHVGVGRPRLGALAAPRAEEGDAHLAVLVEVRVEAVGAVAVVVADGRRLRVVRRELEVEEEEAVLVGGARRTHNHDGIEVLRINVWC